MSNDKIDPSNKDAISSADDLVRTTKSADAELAENELANVTGGKRGAACIDSPYCGALGLNALRRD